MMDFFHDRKPVEGQRPRDPLNTLRATLACLEAEPEATPRVIQLRRILAARIAEMERKSA
jgi:hypothetical protein